MLPRPLTPADLPLLEEIDATIHSSGYLHVTRLMEEFATTWRLEERPRREQQADANRLDDERAYAFRQVVLGVEEGLALAIDIDETPVAALVAQPRPSAGTLHLVDLRVDYDFRRQGMGMALAYAAVGHAREASLRAVTAETRTDNLAAAQFLRRLGFEPSGLDTHRMSNHDLVKELATLLWCLPLD